MEDKDIVEHIHTFIAQYHQLEQQRQGLSLSAEQRRGLPELQVRVDRDGDSLRMGRATRHQPDEASVLDLTAFEPRWPKPRPRPRPRKPPAPPGGPGEPLGGPSERP